MVWRVYQIGKTPRKIPGKVNAQNLVSISWLPDAILGFGNTAVNKIKGTCSLFFELTSNEMGKRELKGEIFNKDMGESLGDLWVNVSLRRKN